MTQYGLRTTQIKNQNPEQNKHKKALILFKVPALSSSKTVCTIKCPSLGYFKLGTYKYSRLLWYVVICCGSLYMVWAMTLKKNTC